jgi:hypothetical protein
MGYRFKPPTVLEGAAGTHRLFQFLEFARGVTVVRVGETFFNVRFPSQDLLAEADDYWLGGSVYDISAETADDLIAAGYGDNVFFE